MTNLHEHVEDFRPQKPETEKTEAFPEPSKPADEARVWIPDGWFYHVSDVNGVEYDLPGGDRPFSVRRLNNKVWRIKQGEFYCLVDNEQGSKLVLEYGEKPVADVSSAYDALHDLNALLYGSKHGEINTDRLVEIRNKLRDAINKEPEPEKQDAALEPQNDEERDPHVPEIDNHWRVEVHWHDAHGVSRGWRTLDDVDEEPANAVSIGVLLSESEDAVVIVPHFVAPPAGVEYCGQITIPRSCVVQILRLERPR